MKAFEINTKNKKKVEKLLKNQKPTIVLFYMTDCSHCIALHPIWKEFSSDLENMVGIDVAQVEFGSMGLLPENIRKSIAGFPTIQIIKDGKAIAEYMGDRTKETLLEFANKYKLPEPIKKTPSAPKIKKTELVATKNKSTSKKSKTVK
jgi:thiol-disulfide isomerase/thioredoxin